MNMPEQTAKTPLLEIHELCLSFHQHRQLAVDRVSLNITAGNTLGLVGASGAGKSSIARAILRLHQPDSGDILFKGESIERMNPQALKATRQRIQLIFQDPSVSLSPRRTVEQTLLEPLQHFDIGDTAYRNKKIRDTLDTVGLNQSVLQRYPHQFSSGQQQRIAIARALVSDPELLIADEAVSSLDVSIQAQILQLIQTLQQELGITLLFISHDLAVIRQIADDVAVMYQGQLLELSPADQFFTEPAHPYSKALLSFSQGEVPVNREADKWHLERSQKTVQNTPNCVFQNFCPDKMTVCEQFEPLMYDIQIKNQHLSGSHCVKCHLYNDVKSHDR